MLYSISLVYYYCCCCLGCEMCYAITICLLLFSLKRSYIIWKDQQKPKKKKKKRRINITTKTTNVLDVDRIIFLLLSQYPFIHPSYILYRIDN